MENKYTRDEHRGREPWTCGNCPCFREHRISDHGYIDGECRANAPQHLGADGDGFWPTVEPSSYGCWAHPLRRHDFEITYRRREAQRSGGFTSELALVNAESGETIEGPATLTPMTLEEAQTAEDAPKDPAMCQATGEHRYALRFDEERPADRAPCLECGMLWGEVVQELIDTIPDRAEGTDDE